MSSSRVVIVLAVGAFVVDWVVVVAVVAVVVLMVVVVDVHTPHKMGQVDRATLIHWKQITAQTLPILSWKQLHGKQA